MKRIIVIVPLSFCITKKCWWSCCRCFCVHNLNTYFCIKFTLSFTPFWTSMSSAWKGRFLHDFTDPFWVIGIKRTPMLLAYVLFISYEQSEYIINTVLINSYSIFYSKFNRSCLLWRSLFNENTRLNTYWFSTSLG